MPFLVLSLFQNRAEHLKISIQEQLKGIGKKNIKSQISNFLILMPFGTVVKYVCVLHDAKIKLGKELLVPML